MTKVLIRDLQTQVAELVPRPKNRLKILYFSGSHQFFRISPEIKSLYDQARKLVHVLAREA